MKNERLSNAWCQGLMLAAIVAVALPAPDAAWAQLSSTVSASGASVFKPAITVLNYACYTIGSFMGIGGIMKLKAHSENPTNAPMSHGVGRCAAAAAFLALPSVVGMLTSTSTTTLSGADKLTNFTTTFN